MDVGRDGVSVDGRAFHSPVRSLRPSCLGRISVPVRVLYPVPSSTFPSTTVPGVGTSYTVRGETYECRPDPPLPSSVWSLWYTLRQNSSCVPLPLRSRFVRRGSISFFLPLPKGPSRRCSPVSFFNSLAGDVRPWVLRLTVPLRRVVSQPQNREVGPRVLCRTRGVVLWNT